MSFDPPPVFTQMLGPHRHVCLLILPDSKWPAYGQGRLVFGVSVGYGRGEVINSSAFHFREDSPTTVCTSKPRC